MATIPRDKPLRAVLWCAVSDEKQADEQKASLAQQERLLREVANREGWVIVDVLIVPGFSRRFYNYLEFMWAATAEGYDAPARLMDHWNNRDFDVLAARYGSRLGREQSIFAEVFSRTIDLGARAYNLETGWVDKSNYRGYVAIGGFAAATEVDKLVNGFKEAMTKRAQNGLPVSHHILISHKVIRNEFGHAQKLIVNDQRRRLFDDFATTLLTGVAWSEIPNILYEQYGHTAPTGKPWSVSVLWRTLHSPWFWGHGARLYADSSKGQQKYGIWCFDASVPTPDGAMIFRDTHEATYTGEIAEQVKGELRRRSELMTGRAGYASASPFTGLLVCGGCGYRLGYKHSKNNNWVGYACLSRDPRYRLHQRHQCESYPRSIKLETVKKWFDARLREMVKKQDASALLPAAVVPAHSQVEALKAEIDDMERKIAGLMLQRLDTPSASQSVLTDLILRADGQLTILRANLDTAQRQRSSTQEQHTAAAETIADIADMNLNTFWQQEPSTVNRMLYALLNDNRLVILNGEIQGVAVSAIKMTPKKKQSRSKRSF